MKLSVGKVTNNALALTNCAFVAPEDFVGFCQEAGIDPDGQRAQSNGAHAHVGSIVLSLKCVAHCHPWAARYAAGGAAGADSAARVHRSSPAPPQGHGPGGIGRPRPQHGAAHLCQPGDGQADPGGAAGFARRAQRDGFVLPGNGCAQQEQDHGQRRGRVRGDHQARQVPLSDAVLHAEPSGAAAHRGRDRRWARPTALTAAPGFDSRLLPSFS